MLAFVTSLRHPLNSSDYARVEALLLDSLGSVLRQDSPGFGVWVVGNRRPKTLPPGVEFVQVDFPPPSPVAGPLTGREAVLLDKGTKLAVGLLAAKCSDASHVMFFDADDFVSRRLAGLVAAEPEANGWYVQTGWRYNADRASVRPQPDFHDHCGTAHIVRSDLYGALDRLDVRSSQALLEQVMGMRLERMFGSHLHVVTDLAAAGTPLAPIPFPAALYRVGTGENHSGIGMGGVGRPVTRAIAQEFGISPTRRDPGALVRSVLPGPQAFSDRLGRLYRWRRAGPA